MHAPVVSPVDVICRAKTLYQKKPGTLELTTAHVQWTADGARAPALKLRNSDATSLFCSKEGVAQVRLKLGVVGDEQGHGFTFTSPPPICTSDRENFKRELSLIISQNRSGPSPAPSLPQPSAPVPILPSSRTQKPSPSLLSHANSPAPSPPPASVPANAAADFQLRKKVLMKHAELAALHKELVVGGQITESEFWEGREHLLAAEANMDSQKKGRPGPLIDPRPGADSKITITPQLVHDIFEEYPIVARAYHENVPTQLTEANFWKRYFQSKLFNSHRVSIRTTATQHVVKDDAIFDKYLEPDDDELEPRRQTTDAVDLFIDLAATREDHGETGNEHDITMQAGKQRGTLPLIRRFNEHSERLLASSLGEIPPAKRRRVDTGEGTTDPYAQIDLDDLHDFEATSSIVLEMQDRHRYFEARATGGPAENESDSKLELREMIHSAQANLTNWSSSLGQLRLDKQESEDALMTMTENVSARVGVKTRKNDIPEAFLRQLTTCQTAANEFLRQFWTTIYPPAEHTLTPGMQLSPAQKNAKVAKMAGYLGKTHEKVAALVKTSRGEGADPAKVELAMKPVLDAVDRALNFYFNQYTIRKPLR